jgi:hypothetical protein
MESTLMRLLMKWLQACDRIPDEGTLYEAEGDLGKEGTFISSIWLWQVTNADELGHQLMFVKRVIVCFHSVSLHPLSLCSFQASASQPIIVPSRG